jgi:hypothetical protein
VFTSPPPALSSLFFFRWRDHLFKGVDVDAHRKRMFVAAAPSAPATPNAAAPPAAASTAAAVPPRGNTGSGGTSTSTSTNTRTTTATRAAKAAARRQSMAVAAAIAEVMSATPDGTTAATAAAAAMARSSSPPHPSRTCKTTSLTAMSSYLVPHTCLWPSTRQVVTAYSPTCFSSGTSHSGKGRQIP